MLDKRPRAAVAPRHGKRQWHTNVWSVAGPDEATTTSSSKAGGKTVYVTKIIGTTTVPSPTTSEQQAVSTSTVPTTTSTSSTTSSSSTSSSSSTTSTSRPATTAQTTSLAGAITITSLPSGFNQVTSASLSSSASASASGAALANTNSASSGMSSGGVLGTVVGVLAAIVALLGLAGCLYRRRTNRQRFGNRRNPFASDKGYRNSATRLTDKSGPAYSGAGGDGYRDDPFDDRVAADAYPLDAMSEKTAPYFPAAYGAAVGRAPSIASGAGMAGRGAASGYAAFGAPDSAYGNGEVTPVVVQHATGTGAMPVPAIAVTHANAPRTRDLTNVGPYARSERAFVQDLPSANAYAHKPYQDDSDHGHDMRSPSPTDYYGQAMTPQATDAFINERYAEDVRAPAQNPFSIGDEDEERLEDQQQQRSGTKTPRQSMPQLPPLSPGVFDSPLTSNFGAFAVSVPPNQLEPPSRSPSQKRSADELKRGYADLAKAAQIDEPVTPINAASQAQQAPPTGQPTLRPPVERYQHGRPLSPLDEVDTPVATPSTGGQPAYYFAGASPSAAAARPYTPENRVYGTAHGSPGSGSLPPHSGIPPSVAFPPPSPGVSLPESPSGSFLGHGGESTGSTPPRRPFRPANAHSTVSLDAAYADSPQGYRFSAGAWDSPVSTRTVPQQQQGLQALMQPVKYGYSVQQGPSRRSIGPEDAYGGI